MKPYKGKEKYSGYALAHIEANSIKCHHYMWCAQVLKTDICKIDGKIRKFNVDTHEEEF